VLKTVSDELAGGGVAQPSHERLSASFWDLFNKITYINIVWQHFCVGKLLILSKKITPQIHLFIFTFLSSPKHFHPPDLTHPFSPTKWAKKIIYTMSEFKCHFHP